MSTTHTSNTVILNVFVQARLRLQDPFPVFNRSVVKKQNGGVAPLLEGPARAARWALKQVQGDDIGEGRA